MSSCGDIARVVVSKGNWLILVLLNYVFSSVLVVQYTTRVSLSYLCMYMHECVYVCMSVCPDIVHCPHVYMSLHTPIYLCHLVHLVTYVGIYACLHTPMHAYIPIVKW